MCVCLHITCFVLVFPDKILISHLPPSVRPSLTLPKPPFRGCVRLRGARKDLAPLSNRKKKKEKKGGHNNIGGNAATAAAATATKLGPP